jgi:hypothetical protein
LLRMHIAEQASRHRSCHAESCGSHRRLRPTIELVGRGPPQGGGREAAAVELAGRSPRIRCIEELAPGALRY